MKKLSALILALIAMVAISMPANAQFKYGLKAGVAVNELHFNTSVFDSDNRAGFTGGAMVEFTVPVLGIGLDASVMYVRRSAQWMKDNKVEKNSRDYIDIPLNFKYKINIPAVNHIVRPFLTTGPSFAFLTTKKDVDKVLKNKTFDTSWNFGVGLELFKHVQVAASYGIGMTKALEIVNIDKNDKVIDGRNRYWTITAAYLF